MKEMYSASVNSLPAIITEAITATDTEIYVDNIDRIPKAPNILVLGENTEIAETVKLVDIFVEERKLIVRRGFQGEAYNWSAGTSIARNFTAYDHDTFKGNIEGLTDIAGDIQEKVVVLDKRIIATANSLQQLGLDNTATLSNIRTALNLKENSHWRIVHLYVPTDSVLLADMPSTTQGNVVIERMPSTNGTLKFTYTIVSSAVRIWIASVTSVTGTLKWKEVRTDRVQIVQTDIANNAVGVNQIGDNSVTTAKIADLNVTNTKIANTTITGNKLANATIAQAQLANNSVGTNQIANLAVTTAKIADLNVTNTKIANTTITGNKLANATIAQAQLANNSVGTNQIANLAVTTAKITDNAVTANKISNINFLNSSVAIGLGSSTGIGTAVTATRIAIGNSAISNSAGALVVGGNSSVGGSNSVVIGAGSITVSDNSMVLGASSDVATSTGAIAVGRRINIRSATNGIAIGSDSSVSNTNATAIGFNATSTHSASTALGGGAISTVSNQILLGGTVSTPFAHRALSIVSDERDKSEISNLEYDALEFINRIEPKQYKLDFRSDYTRWEELTEEEYEKLDDYTRQHRTRETPVFSLADDVEFIEFMSGNEDNEDNSRVADQFKTIIKSDVLKSREEAIAKFKANYITKRNIESNSEENQELTEEFIKENIKKIKNMKLLRVQLAKDGSKTNNRYHNGVLAQQVKTVADEMGFDFAGFKDHAVNGGDDLYSISYEEFIAPIIGAIQQLTERVSFLEKSIAESEILDKVEQARQKKGQSFK